MRHFFLFALLILNFNLHGFECPYHPDFYGYTPYQSHLYGHKCPYFSIGGGVVIPALNSSSTDSTNSVLYSPTSPGVSLFNLPQVTWKNEYKTGFEFYALTGFRIIRCWRTDLEFLYQYLRRDIRGSYSWREVETATLTIFAQNSGNPIRHVSTSAHLFCLLPNLYFDYLAHPCWNLYFGGGVGTAWLKSSSTIRDNELVINTPNVTQNTPTKEQSPSLGGTAFAMQFKLGTTYNLLPNLRLGLNYRLLGTTQFHASVASITSNPDTSVVAVFKTGQKQIRGFLNNSINISLTYAY